MGRKCNSKAKYYFNKPVMIQVIFRYQKQGIGFGVDTKTFEMMPTPTGDGGDLCYFTLRDIFLNLFRNV